MTTMSLFDDLDAGLPAREEPAAGVVLLRRFAAEWEEGLLADIATIVAAAPFRHMETPGGRRMGVAMSNCGQHGWISQPDGYRYSRQDPLTGRPWPVMPQAFGTLARAAADNAGFLDFRPDACLINRYAVGTRLALHQDRDERDFHAPIVSVSLGIPAVFQLGGLQRADRPLPLLLQHADVLVWGGPARLRYHGILPVKENTHPATGPFRINLTFRQAF